MTASTDAQHIINIDTHVVKIAMKSTSLSRFVSPINCEIISRYYRQNCKNSRLFSRNPTFAGEPLGHHQKDTYYQIDHQVGFYYQYSSLIFPQGKTLKNWKANDQKIQEVKQISMVTILKNKVKYFMYFMIFFVNFDRSKIIVE